MKKTKNILFSKKEIVSMVAKRTHLTRKEVEDVIWTFCEVRDEILKSGRDFVFNPVGDIYWKKYMSSTTYDQSKESEPRMKMVMRLPLQLRKYKRARIDGE